MKLDRQIGEACAQVPGLLRAALVRLPDGILVGGVGADHEPLVRAAVACDPEFVELAFVGFDEQVVIQRGRRDARLALATVCTRESNLALVLAVTRQAIASLEETLEEEA